MSNLDFSRTKCLNNIPLKKIEEYISLIDNNSKLDNRSKTLLKTAAGRYAEANIPINYWKLKMKDDFVGDKRLLEKYNEIVSDLKSFYISGKSICFAGLHGRGKTMCSSSILKKATEIGFDALYTTLSDIVSIMTRNDGEEKYSARRELIMVDFLVIDELDPRFMGSDAAADLYARTLENILRTRLQNKLPTIICTNSPNINSTFSGQLKESLNSLFSDGVEMFPVLGDDFRKASK